MVFWMVCDVLPRYQVPWFSSGDYLMAWPVTEPWDAQELPLLRRNGFTIASCSTYRWAGVSENITSKLLPLNIIKQAIVDMPFANSSAPLSSVCRALVPNIYLPNKLTLFTVLKAPQSVEIWQGLQRSELSPIFRLQFFSTAFKTRQEYQPLFGLKECSRMLDCCERLSPTSP